MNITYNKLYLTGRELDYIKQAYLNHHLAGDGLFTKKCHAWLEKNIGCHKALLTPSCTAALEMSAMLIDIKPGDEIIMPSYTFVSTANAFVLRGGVPVFVDIREDTLNIDETLIEAAITSKTKAIVVVHYAGIACEMKTIMDIATQYGLYVVEDAAQGIMSNYHEKPLGSMGQLAALSFHETKNIISGEGGALLINDPELIERAEIIREKGTDRSRFFRGQIDKYTWQDIGSSFLPSEIVAAFLWAQMEEAEEITQRRLHIWNSYQSTFSAFDQQQVRCPIVASHCVHNAHLFYLLLPDLHQRTNFIAAANHRGIDTLFHYIPLHLSPAGKKYARTHGQLTITENLASRLVRLPIWLGIEPYLIDTIAKLKECIIEIINQGSTLRQTSM
jgi:dTDP-4-amino-4,6-dideoxygalactose transaminase